MNLPRPDTGNFNRLIVSLGVGALLAAIVLPWLFLRESSVLLIPESELARLTQTARETLVERQETVADLQDLVWIAASVLAVVGLGLLVWGAMRLHRQQPIEDRAFLAHAIRAENEAHLEPQSREEREHGRVSDAGSANAEPSGDGPPYEEGLVAIELRRRQEGRAMARRVMERLRELEPPGHEVATEVKLVWGSQSAGVLLDAVFTSTDGGEPDLIVEIKTSTGRRPESVVEDGTAQLLAAMSRYESVTGRSTRGWLIVVAIPESDFNEPLSSVRDRALLRWSHPDVFIDLLYAEQLPELRFPLS